MTITKIILSIFLLSCFFLVGCEEVSENNYMVKNKIIVKYINDPTSSQTIENKIILIIVDDNNDNFIITSNTDIMKQRASNSGFSIGTISDLIINGKVEVIYDINNINYKKNPIEYYLDKIYIYN